MKPFRKSSPARLAKANPGLQNSQSSKGRYAPKLSPLAEANSLVIKRQEIEELFLARTFALKWVLRIALVALGVFFVLRGHASSEISDSATVRIQKNPWELAPGNRHWLVQAEMQTFTLSSLGGPMIGSTLGYEIEDHSVVGFSPMLSASHTQNFSFGAFYRRGLTPTSEWFGELSTTAFYMNSSEALYGGLGAAIGTTLPAFSPRYPVTASGGLERALNLWIPKFSLAMGWRF